MIAVRLVLLAGIFVGALARGEAAKRWPVGAGEFATTVGIPEGFVPMRGKPPAI